MRLFSIRLNFLLFLLALTATPLFADDKKESRVFLAADQWCPYNCEIDGNPPGYVVEIAREAFRRHGHDLVYIQAPWERSLYEVRAGRYDGVIGAIKDEAPDLTYPQESVGLSSIMLAVRSDNNWTYKEPSDFKGMRIGIVPGFSYGDPIDNYFATDNVKITRLYAKQPLQQSLQLLAANRLDLVLDDETVMRYTIKKLQMDELVKFAGLADEAVPLFIGFTPKSARGKTLASQLSDGIRAMRLDGTLAKILQRYGLNDWNPTLKKGSK
ncbi:MAG: transporter substrate-binding domain-containing protein [Magnetococcales bacterium]|nr:transporter substrate-binding domain-containing protein [Magnetococcales bacterium]